MLCQQSDYFEKALHERFKEGADGCIRLPEDDPEVVSAFLTWIYKNDIRHIDDSTADSFDITLSLYRFAQKICLVSLQNACLDHVRDIYKNTHIVPTWDEMCHHYENSVEEDRMRIVLVDHLAWSLLASTDARAKEIFSGVLRNEGLVIDLFQRMNEAATATKHKIKPVRERDFYHVEESELCRR